MKLDLTKVIDKIPDYAIKASGNRGSPKTKNKKTAQDYPKLGDIERFKNFPDKVDLKFISMYRESLDNFLIPYIQQGDLTVSSANNFIENLVEQIFGNEKHFGIFSYLKETNVQNAADRELVRTAERLVNSGWRVGKDKNTNRYKITNSEGSAIIDATGKSEFLEESASLVMDEGSAHLFIDSVAASRIESLARAVGMDADSMNEINSLNDLLLYTKDSNIIGHIENYNKLKRLLKKKNSYQTVTTGTSFLDLYNLGYTLSPKMIFSRDDRVVLSKGSDEVIVYPVGMEINQVYGASKDLLAVISSNVKKKLLSGLNNVKPQLLEEIKDFNRVVAVMSEYWYSDRVLLSYSEMIDSFVRLDSYVKTGEVSKEFYNKLFSALAAIVVTEVILLGNKWFSLSLLGFDSITGKVYSYANKDSFTYSRDELNNFINSYETSSDGKPSFSLLTKDIYPFGLDKGNLSILINYLPKEYFKALSGLDFKIEGYSLDFTGVSSYMSKAVEFLLRSDS